MAKLTVLSATLAGLVLLGSGCSPDALDPALEEGGARDPSFRHGTPPGPAPWTYQLTSYADPYTPACGGKKANGTWYYATGAWTFGCGSRLRLEANGKCVVVAVVDNGPASWVERKAKQRCGGTGYIIDASPLAAKHLFGVSSAGWSDCFEIQVTEVDESAPTGPVPCDTDLGAASGPAPEATKGFIGDPCTQNSDCSTGLCVTEGEGFPLGTCSQACDYLCPDMVGKPITFCTYVDGAPRCVSRCNTGLFPGTGCRPGYQCVAMPRWNQEEVEQSVCLP